MIGISVLLLFDLIYCLKVSLYISHILELLTVITIYFLLYFSLISLYTHYLHTQYLRTHYLHPHYSRTQYFCTHYLHTHYLHTHYLRTQYLHTHHLYTHYLHILTHTNLRFHKLTEYTHATKPFTLIILYNTLCIFVPYSGVLIYLVNIKLCTRNTNRFMYIVQKLSPPTLLLTYVTNIIKMSVFVILHDE